MVTKSVRSKVKSRPLGVVTSWKWRLAAEQCCASSTTCIRQFACRKPSTSAVPTICSSRTAAALATALAASATAATAPASASACLLFCRMCTASMPLSEKA